MNRRRGGTAAASPAIGGQEHAAGVAVLIDASEPMWRSRKYAAKVTDNTGPTTAERWVMQDREWLSV